MAKSMRGARSVQIRDESVCGGKVAVLESGKRCVAAIACPVRNAKGLYIGIASGRDPLRAVRRRFDTYKRSRGINEIVVVYASSSESNSRCVEKALVDWFAGHKRSFNRVGRGGGRPSSGPLFFVDVAVRR